MVDAIVAAVAGAAIVIVVRWTVGHAFHRVEAKLAKRDPSGVARRRTTFAFLQRVIVVIVAAIAVWNVLSLYTATAQFGKALLASSAVIALFAGLAFSTPLSNLGSGMLVAFTQPLRLGDRVTVAEQTGFVEEMSLIYTTLVTDDARRVFIPNSMLTSSTIVNRTIRDPRRVVERLVPGARCTRRSTRRPRPSATRSPESTGTVGSRRPRAGRDDRAADRLARRDRVRADRRRRRGALEHAARGRARRAARARLPRLTARRARSVEADGREGRPRPASGRESCRTAWDGRYSIT